MRPTSRSRRMPGNERTTPRSSGASPGPRIGPPCGESRSAARGCSPPRGQPPPTTGPLRCRPREAEMTTIRRDARGPSGKMRRRSRLIGGPFRRHPIGRSFAMQPGIDGADAAKDDVSGTFVVEDPSDSGLVPTAHIPTTWATFRFWTQPNASLPAPIQRDAVESRLPRVVQPVAPSEIVPA